MNSIVLWSFIEGCKNQIPRTMLHKLRFTTVRVSAQSGLRVSHKIEGDLTSLLKKLRPTEEPGDHLVCIKSFEEIRGTFSLLEPDDRRLKLVRNSDSVSSELRAQNYVFRLRLGQMLIFQAGIKELRVWNTFSARGSYTETAFVRKNEPMPPYVIIDLVRAQNEKSKFLRSLKKSEENDNMPVPQGWSPSLGEILPQPTTQQQTNGTLQNQKSKKDAQKASSTISKKAGAQVSTHRTRETSSTKGSAHGPHRN